jgi:hypothetical protein
MLNYANYNRSFFIIIFCVCGLCYFQSSALADNFVSELDKTCAQTCADNNQVCKSISTADDNTVNNNYCTLGDSSDTCGEAQGDCNTMINDEGFNGCTYSAAPGAERCSKYPERQAKWTYCNCEKNSDFSILEVQPIDGQVDYMTATDSAPYINSYQPFENYIFHDDNNHLAGSWTKIDAVLFKAMTALAGDTHVGVFLKMALGNDNYSANCDGNFGTDWAWLPVNEVTVPADGVYHDEAAFIDPNADQCAYYNETYFCTICGIGFYTYPAEGVTWVSLGAADYPKFQLDTAGERVSDYSLWFLLAGTKNAAPVSACNCASSSNIVFQGICEGFCYLFYPTDYGLTTFQTNYTNLKAAFPFNTYYQLTDAISAASTITDDTSNTIGIPMVRKVAGHAQYFMQPVISSSSLPNAIGGSAANIVRNSLSTLIWLLTGGIAILLFIKF